MDHTGREVLRAAKGAASYPPPALCLPVGAPAVGWLRPVVTREGAVSAADVRALTAWRNRFREAWLTEFEATEPRTERWLVDTVGPDDSRILFMVDDLSGSTVGHMALAGIDWRDGTAEADAVVRGADAPRGFLTRALHAMWAWGRGSLGLSVLRVRVRSDNAAIAFYEKAGFRELRRVALRREDLVDEVRWVEDPSVADSGVSLVHMELEAAGA
jgi:RimJ/RimL family protein N-acetyltransferase